MRSITLSLLLGALLAAPLLAEELPDFDTLWDYGDPAATEARFRALLPGARAAGDVSYELQLMTQIARTLGLRGRFDEALAVLDEVDGKLTQELRTARVRSLLERGRVMNSSDRTEPSRALFLKAFKLALAAKADFHAIDAAHMLGIVMPDDKCLAWNARAMELAEASEDPRAKGWLGPLYHNTGMTYLDRGDLENALRLFRKDWEYRKPGKNEVATRIAKWCVAHTIRRLGRIDEALAMQRELESEWAQAGAPSGYVFEEIGECLLVQGMIEEARPYFGRAWALLEDEAWIAKSDPGRLPRIKKLGGVVDEEPSEDR